MKGVSRQLDKMGRVVIPREIINILDIKFKDELEFFSGDNGRIILKKFKRDCSFCDSKDGLIRFKSSYVCKGCIGKLGAGE